MQKQASEREFHKLGGTPLVLVVEVVSVLPHVHGQDGLLAIGDGIASSDRLIHHLRLNISTKGFRTYHTIPRMRAVHVYALLPFQERLRMGSH